MIDKTPIEKAAEDIRKRYERFMYPEDESEIAGLIVQRIKEGAPKAVKVRYASLEQRAHQEALDRVRRAIGLRDAEAEGECASCGEGIANDECPNSKRSCGHHCNHIWDQDKCCWCGEEFDEEETEA